MTQMNNYKLYIVMYCMKYRSMWDDRKDSYYITTDSSGDAFIPSLPFQCFVVWLFFFF